MKVFSLYFSINIYHSIHLYSNLTFSHLFDTDTPGEPVGPITFSNISEGKCSLSWNPPEKDGCSEISHYIIEKRETAKISWALVSDECKECTFHATKLIKTNEYQFRVSAVNKFGVGRPLESSPIIAQMQYSKLSFWKVLKINIWKFSNLYYIYLVISTHY